MAHRRRSPLPAAALAAALLLAAPLLAACGGGGGTATTPPPPAGDLKARLQALPGVLSVTERTAAEPGTRFFVLGFDQPVDGANPSGPHFTQRATLLWRADAAPTVLATTGYGISTSSQGQGELTQLLAANQVLLEHRYFAPSAPATMDWARLDIAQAAGDQHRVVLALKNVLTGKWLNTGGSKGGMTAIFHRVFWPDDVTATVAYVAPLSFGRLDARYIPYLEAIGPVACRDAVHAAQREILARAAEVEPLLAAEAASYGDTYHALGLSETLRLAVLEAPFVFWQYGGESACTSVPSPGATPQALSAFLQQVYLGSVAGSWGDATLDYYAPYYYQSATQLGGPDVKQDHLADLLATPLVDSPELYPPFGVAKPWDAQAMVDVDAWVQAHGDRIMWIYGGRDPWSGGQFTPGPGRDAVKYLVALGNHGSSIAQLDPADRDEARARLRAWMGVTAAAASTPEARRAADDALPFDPWLLLPPRPGRRP